MGEVNTGFSESAARTPLLYNTSQVASQEVVLQGNEGELNFWNTRSFPRFMKVLSQFLPHFEALHY